ncbi:hypothetical protein CC2G_002909 [Coprinopsis cinerea AmutBmut pab1-1]|nr:hypothetical protein CC2G_002909 [Coprinopsis cinerea AmutBmut pab1-1]
MKLGYKTQLLVSVVIEVFVQGRKHNQEETGILTSCTLRSGYLVHSTITCTLAILVAHTRTRIPAVLPLTLTALFCISLSATALDAAVLMSEELDRSVSYPEELCRPRVLLQVASSMIFETLVMSRWLQLWYSNAYYRSVLSGTIIVLFATMG